MPPPQHVLAFNIRGFVCRSCISKPPISPRQRSRFKPRNFATGPIPTRQRRASEKSKPAIREKKEKIDDEALDSEDDLDEATILDALEAEVRERRKDLAEYGPSRQGGVPKNTVKYFEETLDGTRTEDEDDFDDEANLEALETEIRDLKEDINDETGGFLKSLHAKRYGKGSEAANPLADSIRAQLAELKKYDLKNLSDDDRLRLREVFLKDRKQDMSSTNSHTSIATWSPEETLNLGLRQQTPSTEDGEGFEIPLHKFSPAERLRMSELAFVLKRPALSPKARRKGRSKIQTEKDVILRAWRAYSLSRHALASEVLTHDDRWKILNKLWKIFQVEGLQNLDRMARLRILGDDMVALGRVMHWSQKLLYFEAIFIGGERDRAIKMWEDYRFPAYDTPEAWKSYLELGARMLAQHRLPRRAASEAQNYIEIGNNPADFRIVLPLMRANLLEREDPSSITRAWALYIRLRAGLGSLMTMDDYDVIISMFLSAGQKDLALGAFKDMMITGEASMRKADSIALYRTATRHRRDLSSLIITDEELNEASLCTLNKLPAKLKNKFFFGKWIKWLIGDKKLKEAHQVVQLMSSHGITPSPIQLNGLVGAWFRENSTSSVHLAESTAWKMIEERHKFVQQRDRLDPSIRLIPTKDMPSNKNYQYILPAIPPATIETFCILISHYRKSQKPVRMTELMNAFERSRLQPSTHFMNELLWNSHNEHRNDKVVATYRLATEKQSISPDFWTYLILWHNLKKEVDPIRAFAKARKNERHLKCRGLFADMMAKLPRMGNGDFPRHLYQVIVQTFSIAQDLSGTAVALRALRKHYGAYPEPETARVIVLQLARLGLVNEGGFMPRRLDVDSSITKARIANVVKILRGFKEKRVQVLRQQGIEFSELEGEAKAEEPILLLTEILRFAAVQTTDESSRTVTEQSIETAKSMGVPDCVPWESPKEIL
ncbi:pentatricopeptide repeat protein [Diplocarpon rosae]|nr:pentatricopeptide repeat protein [Diplocarpon rosae]